MPTFEFPDTYTSSDGEYSFPWATVAPSVVVALATKAAHHVFGNEAISKASTAKSKAGVIGDEYTPAFTKEMYDNIVFESRNGYHKQFADASWGSGARGPRMPAANRLEQIFNMLLADASRAAIAKMGFKPVDGKKDEWTAPNGRVFNLSDAMTAYRDNPVHGAERVESLNRQARAKHDAELAIAAEKKAAKDREAGSKAEMAEGELVL